MLRDAGMSTDDFVRHMAWVWCYMFERLVPNKHPSGRMVLVADCRGIHLRLAMGEGQVRTCMGEGCMHACMQRLGSDRMQMKLGLQQLAGGFAEPVLSCANPATCSGFVIDTPFAPASGNRKRHPSKQLAARALGVVAEANPERMAKTLVVNAPTWFNLIWKVSSDSWFGSCMHRGRRQIVMN